MSSSHHFKGKISKRKNEEDEEGNHKLQRNRTIKNIYGGKIDDDSNLEGSDGGKMENR